MTDTIHLGTLEDGTPHTVPVSAFDYHGQFIGPSRYGKTRLLAHITQQLIEQRDDAAFVVIDPKGDLYDLVKSWAYERGLNDRLLLLDVRDHEYILGFNPLKPHRTLEPQEQANLQYDVLGRALEITEKTAVVTHEREKWMRSALLALIHAQLTYCDATQLLDPASGELRAGVLPHLPPSTARADFLRLQDQTTSDNATTLRTIRQEVGSSMIQFARLTDSSTLRTMYASDHTIDFRRVFDDRRILLVRLALERNVLALDHQKLLGMQIVNEIIREVMGRSPLDRVQTYCMIDEAGRFATKDVTEVLEQAASFRLSLLLAHQQCEQLKDGTDRKLLDSLLSNSHIKFVTGGLTQADAKEIGDTINRHLLDPDKPFLATSTKRQLQKIAPVVSVTEGTQEAEGYTTAEQWANASGHVATAGASSSRGRHRSAGQSAGDSAATSTTIDPVTGVPIVTTTTGLSGGSSDAEGDAEGTGANSAQSEIETSTEGGSTAHSTTRGRSRAVTVGMGVQPTEVFEEFQPEPLDTQQHRFTSKMIRLPAQHQMSVVRKEPPVAFRVADVPDPELTPEQIQYLDEQLAKRNPEHYSTPAQIEAMTAARHQRLLPSSAVVEDDPSPTEPDPFQDNDLLPARPEVLKKKPKSQRSKPAR